MRVGASDGRVLGGGEEGGGSVSDSLTHPKKEWVRDPCSPGVPDFSTA